MTTTLRLSALALRNTSSAPSAGQIGTERNGDRSETRREGRTGRRKPGTGFIVNAFGFSAAFLFLSACALVTVLLFWLGVPETREMATEAPPEDAKPLPASAVAGT
jgi:hypothetical protein